MCVGGAPRDSSRGHRQVHSWATHLQARVWVNDGRGAVLTRGGFDARANDPCRACGSTVVLEDNPNNGATQVVCSNSTCKLARRPWGLVINIKKTARKTRPPLPHGEALDSIWEKF